MEDDFLEIEIPNNIFEFLTKLSEETGKSINDLIIDSFRELLELEKLKQNE